MTSLDRLRLLLVAVLAGNYHAFVQLVASQAEANRLFRENARLAQTDSLTLLPNRRSFFTRLGAMIDASPAAEARFALAIFDLDRFKPIKDTYGHIVGDRVLAETGRRSSSPASRPPAWKSYSAALPAGAATFRTAARCAGAAAG